MERRVSVITLGYRNFERCRDFYEQLGWVGESPDGEVLFIQAGGTIVAFWDRALAASNAGVDDGGGWGGITLAHNVAEPETVDAVLDEVRAAGGTVLRVGTPTSWGGYAGIFQDPEGHVWEVAHNPSWVLAADGTVHLPRPKSAS